MRTRSRVGNYFAVSDSAVFLQISKQRDHKRGGWPKQLTCRTCRGFKKEMKSQVLPKKESALVLNGRFATFRAGETFNIAGD